MSPLEDQCDYCYEAKATKMRPVGMTTLSGEPEKQYPLVKFWCGECAPDDDMSVEAYRLLKDNLMKPQK